MTSIAGTSSSNLRWLLSSEALHYQYANLPQFSEHNNEIGLAGDQSVIVCYKDHSSFSKATRKIRRTTRKLCNREICDCYYIDQPQQPLSRVIHQRLSVDGGPAKQLELNVDKSVDTDDIDWKLNLVKFSYRTFLEKKINQEEEEEQTHARIKSNEPRNSNKKLHNTLMSILFIDLDSLLTIEMQPLTVESPDDRNVTIASDSDSDLVHKHITLLNKILSSLLKQTYYCIDSQTIAHVKSHRLHLILKNNFRERGQWYMRTNELDQYCVCPRSPSVNTTTGILPRSSASSYNGQIRRLRIEKGAAQCPLSLYPARYIQHQLSPSFHESEFKSLIEICRFYNYDAERGCLRVKKGRCGMDHEHCHACGKYGHRALECLQNQNNEHSNGNEIVLEQSPNFQQSIVFLPAQENVRPPVTVPLPQSILNTSELPLRQFDHNARVAPIPALLALGGRLRGRTLATCEILPLSLNDSLNSTYKWSPLPNLLEHRGSHAACSPIGTGLVIVMGGGGVDGNLDSVEVLHLGGKNNRNLSKEEFEGGKRWHAWTGKLSSARHAFGAVVCVVQKNGYVNQKGILTTAERGLSTMMVTLYVVGGWKHGSVSCKSTEKLCFEIPRSIEDTSLSNFSSRKPSASPSQLPLDTSGIPKDLQWEICESLILPRRLHSVVASASRSYIYVFGGFIDERRTTPSIEKFDLLENRWIACEDLPYGDYAKIGRFPPLVQAVIDWSYPQDNEDVFLIFPFDSKEKILRYKPDSGDQFTPVILPKERNEDSSTSQDQEQYLTLPISHWSSFAAISSSSLKKAYLLGGTINGKWTGQGFELDLMTMTWTELPEISCPRRRLATLIVE